MNFYNSVKKTKDDLLTDEQFKKTRYLSVVLPRLVYDIYGESKKYKIKLRVRKK